MSDACGASGMRCRLPYIHTVDDHDRWAPIVVGGEGLVAGGDGGGCGEIIIHHSSFMMVMTMVHVTDHRTDQGHAPSPSIIIRIERR